MATRKEQTMAFINKLLKNWVVIFVLVVFSIAVSYAIMFRPLTLKYGDAEIKSEKADMPRLK